MVHRPQFGAGLFPYGASELHASYPRYVVLGLLLAVSCQVLGVIACAVLGRGGGDARDGTQNVVILEPARWMPRVLLPPPPPKVVASEPKSPYAIPVPVVDPPAIEAESPELPADPAASSMTGNAGGETGLPNGTASGANGVVTDEDPPITSYIAVEVEPKPVKTVVPSYPAIARMAEVEGKVVVKALVTIEGRVKRAEAIAGPEPLRAAAVDAAMGWVFSPAIMNGQPVAVWVTIPFVFRMDGIR